jgi:hypothetical protein
MPSIRTEVPHRLGHDEARDRLETLMQSIHDDYPDMVREFSSRWEANTLRVSFVAYGFSIASDVHVEADRVKVDGNVPLAALPFRGKIQQTIVGKLNQILGGSA